MCNVYTYAQRSKHPQAANVLFTVELQRRLDAAGVRASAVALHPGLAQTDLSRYVIGGVGAEDTRLSETNKAPSGGLGGFLKKGLDSVIQPVDKGANTQVFLAAAQDSGGDRTARGRCGTLPCPPLPFHSCEVEHCSPHSLRVSPPTASY